MCNITVRNCTFDRVSKAITLCMFYHKGNLTIEDNEIEGSVTGISMLAVGSMVACRNNTISATYGIVLDNKEQLEPV
ncbi:MAG: hypothetical protein GWN89_08965, partial [Thermoplasmata archaeon]|nr:hypothetical protein [Thermoplasmata archaeon]NIS20049.1 hypothetical protein [Thermoplasmata archaeon]